MNTAQREIFAKMTASQKLDAALALRRSALTLKASCFRAKHPNWEPEQIAQAARESFMHARD